MSSWAFRQLKPEMEMEILTESCNFSAEMLNIVMTLRTVEHLRLIGKMLRSLRNYTHCIIGESHGHGDG